MIQLSSNICKHEYNILHVWIRSGNNNNKKFFYCDFCMCFTGGNWHISEQNHVCVFSNAASSEIFEPQQDGNLHWTLHQFHENDPFSRSPQCLNKIRKVIYVPVLNRSWLCVCSSLENTCMEARLLFSHQHLLSFFWNNMFPQQDIVYKSTFAFRLKHMYGAPLLHSATG